MRNIQKNFIFINFFLLFSIFLFFKFKFSKFKDLTNLFEISIPENKVDIFIVKKNFLTMKEYFIENLNEIENIKQVLEILKENHKKTLDIQYSIKNIYIEEEMYISLKIEKNNLNEMEELLFVYSIVNSIAKKRKLKFFNSEKGHLFKFIDSNFFFEENKAFGEI